MMNRFYCQNVLKRLTVAGAVAALFGCGFGSNPDKLVEEAKSSFAKGDMKTAVISLKSALSTAPDHPQARLELGKLYLEFGDGASAEKELRRAAELGLPKPVVELARALLMQGKAGALIQETNELQLTDQSAKSSSLPPESRATLIALRGNALLQIGRIEEARQSFESALELAPNSLESMLGNARLAVIQRKTDVAREWYGKAVEAHPKSAAAWALLGHLERSLGNLDKAEDAFTKAIGLRPDPSSDHLERAQVRIGRNNLRGAEEDVQAAQKSGRHSDRVGLMRGLLYYTKGELPKAQEQFELVIKAVPDHPSALYYLGGVYALQHRYQAAETHLRKFLEVSPASNEGALLLGSVLLLTGDYDNAEKTLKQVLLRNPSDRRALTLLSDASFRGGKSKEAIAYLQKAVAEHANSSAARSNLGLGYLMAGDTGEALKHLEAAVELDPKSSRAEVALIRGYMQGGKFAEAIKTAKQLQTRTPKDPMPFVYEGDAHAALKNDKAAEEAYMSAMKLRPGFPEAGHGLAALATKKKDFKAAQGHYEGVLKANPSHLTTLMALAQLDGAQGNIDGAVSRLKQALKTHPSALQPRILLSRYYLRKGDARAALDLLASIESESSNNVELLTMLGEAYIGTDKAQSAIPVLEKALRLNPKNADAHFLIGKALLSANDPKGARARLDRALALDPKHIPSQLAMVRLLTNENKLADAKRRFDALSQHAADHPEFIAQKASIAMKEARYKDAIAGYEQALKIAPDAQPLIIALASALMRNNESTRAAQTLAQWLEKNPNDHAARYGLAEIYLLTGQNGQAADALRKVVAAKPNHAMALNNLAWITRRDDPRKAREYIEQANRLLPEMPLVLDTLGVILMEQGETPKAVEVLKKAHSGDPGNASTRWHLAQALAKNGANGEARDVLRALLASKTPFAAREEAQALFKKLGG